jgi:hypothetical protein
MDLMMLLNLLQCYETFCSDWFSSTSKWGHDVDDLLDDFMANQAHLLMDTAALQKIVPQTVWALVMEGHKFFTKMTTKVETEQEKPKAVQSTLYQHSATLAGGVEHQMVGFPTTWAANPLVVQQQAPP